MVENKLEKHQYSEKQEMWLAIGAVAVAILVILGASFLMWWMFNQ